MLARRSGIRVLYQGVDITSNITKDLLSFTYTDNASGNADDIDIALKDNKGKWMNEWFPEKGDSLKAEINTLNWRHDGDRQTLPCGSFIIDEPTYSGRPRVMNLKAISIPANSNFTETKRSRSWSKISIKAMAQDIANRAGLKLFFDSSTNPILSWVDQTETSDMAFLAEVCEKEGLAFKITDQSIVIFNEAEYEKRESVARYNEESSSILEYSFKTTLTRTAYAGCKVKYYDVNLGKNIEYLFSVKEINPKVDKVYRLNARVKTGEEAKRLAQKTLRNLNKKEYQGNLKVIGNVDLVGGSCIDLINFGKFSGKYFIDKASHQVGSGYITDLELHRVLEGY